MLKAKDGEISALTGAIEPQLVTPIFELQNVAKPRTNKDTGELIRAKSAATDASYFVDDIARQWHRFMYVDVHRVSDSTTTGNWWALLAATAVLRPQPPEMAPVIHVGDDLSATANAAPLAALAGRAALRVSMPIDDPSVLAAELASVARAVGLTADEVDVIVDWQDRTEMHELDQLVAATRATIAALGSAHGAIITTGTPNCDACTQSGDWSFNRREWWLWQRLSATSDAEIIYGDYALYPPGDPVNAQPQYGHLRYSYGHTLWVHRRSKPPAGSTPGGLGGAFAECCRTLVGSTHDSGASFSTSDAVLHAAATGTTTVRVPGKWRILATGHHLELVRRQLAAPPLPPPPGTK